ncbi:MAG TPA: rRNA pseudouridine synthase [Candidatus Mediterraneibacter faecavium]|uniref:Pseudouridine synthase n=1 Tax=Candidatus Mediterraneibacter faecavium TaxID=2838668 RepID=A0A9D2QDR8_9FIRM|nr:rRNA pseudouridine synthase [Candidatus Mediterraneibacter faecavium]
MMIRLDKYLADMGIGTRSRIKKEIRSGQVIVNGKPICRPELKINTDQDEVLFQGEPVTYEEYEYYMLNKPAGVISAASDRQETTVVDLIKDRKRDDLFPVGRLDKDTEGLLIITNNGELAHRLLSPKKHVDKVYFAKVKGIVTEDDIECFAQGLDIGDEKPTLPAELVICSSDEISGILLTIREGRFHQVKRMFQAVGKEVVYLKRLRMGPVTLDDSLKPGEYRRLTEEEVDRLCSQERKP